LIKIGLGILGISISLSVIAALLSVLPFLLLVSGYISLWLASVLFLPGLLIAASRGSTEDYKTFFYIELGLGGYGLFIWACTSLFTRTNEKEVR
jgi:hypothetical protein